MMFGFAWVNPEDKTFLQEYGREDEQVFDAAISQDEGDFAAAEIEIVNPRVGLLATGRPRWAWISFKDDGDATWTPLFFGRIVGVPADLDDISVKLNFIARPEEYETLKEAVAEENRVFPYFDPIWFDDASRMDPDNILESRFALYDTDRVTHNVALTSLVNGEDGTIEVDEGIVFADSMSVSYGDAPCRQINCQATVTWNQAATGVVPLKHGWFPADTYETFTGDGLIANWPKPGDSIGGGWSFGPGTYANRVDGHGPDIWTWDDWGLLFAQGELGKTVFCPTWAVGGAGFYGGAAHLLSVKRWLVQGGVTVQYDVSRGKTEVITFTLKSDTQSILTDETDGLAQDLIVQSSEIANPIDVVPATESGASSDETTLRSPLRVPWARTYFTTDRGSKSIEYLICLARARLIASARCVDITIDIPFEFAVAQAISCRKNLIIINSNLPGGQAAGKIKHYELSMRDGVLNCSVTIGCTIGHGGTVTAVDGDPTYCEDDYVEKDYQIYENEYVMPIDGEVAYRTINGLVPLDDGFDFDRMDSRNICITPLTATNLADVQEDFIKAALEPDTVYQGLNTMQTTFNFELKPVNNGPFTWALTVDTTLLKIAKTIDLEAESSSS